MHPQQPVYAENAVEVYNLGLEVGIAEIRGFLAQAGPLVLLQRILPQSCELDVVVAVYETPQAAATSLQLLQGASFTPSNRLFLRKATGLPYQMISLVERWQKLDPDPIFAHPLSIPLRLVDGGSAVDGGDAIGIGGATLQQLSGKPAGVGRSPSAATRPSSGMATGSPLTASAIGSPAQGSADADDVPPPESGGFRRPSAHEAQDAFAVRRSAASTSALDAFNGAGGGGGYDLAGAAAVGGVYGLGSALTGHLGMGAEALGSAFSAGPQLGAGLDLGSFSSTRRASLVSRSTHSVHGSPLDAFGGSGAGGPGGGGSGSLRGVGSRESFGRAASASLDAFAGAGGASAALDAAFGPRDPDLDGFAARHRASQLADDLSAYDPFGPPPQAPPDAGPGSGAAEPPTRPSPAPTPQLEGRAGSFSGTGGVRVAASLAGARTPLAPVSLAGQQLAGRGGAMAFAAVGGAPGRDGGLGVSRDSGGLGVGYGDSPDSGGEGVGPGAPGAAPSAGLSASTLAALGLPPSVRRGGAVPGLPALAPMNASQAAAAAIAGACAPGGGGRYAPHLSQSLGGGQGVGFQGGAGGSAAQGLGPAQGLVGGQGAGGPDRAAAQPAASPHAHPHHRGSQDLQPIVGGSTLSGGPRIHRGACGASKEPTVKLWMGGVDGSATPETALAVFGRFGEVIDIELQLARHERGRTDQWGFVVFRDVAAARSAYDALLGEVVPTLTGGRKLKLQYRVADSRRAHARAAVAAAAAQAAQTQAAAAQAALQQQQQQRQRQVTQQQQQQQLQQQQLQQQQLQQQQLQQQRQQQRQAPKAPAGAGPTSAVAAGG